MARRKSYRPKPIKRKSSKMTVRRHQKPKDKKYLDTLSKTLRLLILVAICGFVIYRLFLADKSPGKKTVEQKKPKQKVQVAPVDTVKIDTVAKEIKISSLSKEEALDHVLNKIFSDFNLETSWIARSGNSLKVQLPTELPAITIIWEIIQQVEKLNLKVIKSEEDLKGNKSTISIGKGRNVLLTIIFNSNDSIKRKTGKIAIIIDDFGYSNNRTTEQFLALNYPITLAIIPGQKYSTEIAAAAKKNRKSFLIHLPMEALEEEVEQSDYTIYSDMSDAEIAECVQKSLDLLPEAVGINNHMGSRATGDSRVMNIVIDKLKSKGKFFIDSRTTSQSVIAKVANQNAFRFATSDGFLERDRNEDEQYIQQKLSAIAKIAKKRGRAIVIGHPYKETLAALTEALPKLEKQGFQIVPVTSVVQ